MSDTRKTDQNERDEAFAALEKQYKPLIDRQVSLFAGAEVDADSLQDWRQEARIGLFKAMEHYRAESGVPFAAYAKMCVQHRLISYQRQLRWAQLLCPLTEEAAATLPDEEQTRPEPRTVLQAEEAVLWEKLGQVLTTFESDCLRCHLEGYSYEETAVGLQTEAKAVDNALQRARRKLRKTLQAQPDFFRS